MRSRYQPSSRYNCMKAPVYSVLPRTFGLHEELRDFGLDTTIAGDVKNQPESTPITATSLMPASGAVTRTATHGKLDLCGACMRPLHVRGRLPICVLSWVPKRHCSGADAGFHRAQRLGIGMTGRHTDVPSTSRPIFLLHQAKSIRWPPVTFTVECCICRLRSRCGAVRGWLSRRPTCAESR